jgi:hypothetical protein
VLSGDAVKFIMLLEVGVAYREGLHKCLTNAGTRMKNRIYLARNLLSFLMKRAIEISAYKY